MAGRGAKVTDVDTRSAVPLDAEHLCCAMREIEHAIGDKRATVVDAHDHFAPVLEISDLDEARNRQGRMRGGDRFLIIHFATRGALTMEGGAIPRGRSGGFVTRLSRGDVPTAVRLIGRANA